MLLTRNILIAFSKHLRCRERITANECIKTVLLLRFRNSYTLYATISYNKIFAFAIVDSELL